ncbi:hypothetical protein EYR36_003676 [Pleurotus pulmonarius]|nr:hypothetical protein EYR36_003676 [Pleurotus pulmonarius]
MKCQKPLSVEILASILSYLDGADLSRCATVSKEWSSISLDLKWSTVTDLVRLLHALIPLTQGPNNVYRFSRTLGPADWKRFEPTAARVRHLRYLQDTTTSGRIHPQSFQDIGFTRLRIDILPNLRTLAWGIDPIHSVLFMHPGVRVFVASFTTMQVLALPNLFANVAIRIPQLKTLDLRTSVPVNTIQQDFVRLIQQLPGLESINLPPNYLIDDCIDVLSRLSQLKKITLSSEGPGNPVDLPVSVATPAPGSFPSISSMSFSLPFDASTRLIYNLSGCRHLEELGIHSTEFGSEASIHDLLEAICSSAPSVKKLSILPKIRFPHDDPKITLPFEHLQPISHLTELTHLSIHYQHALTFSTADLAQSLPRLRSCYLNPYIPNLSNPLHLDSLIPFARHCLHLRELGLYLSASEEGVSLYSSPPTFRSLVTLDVGNSHIEDHLPVALFLAQILPFRCVITSQMTIVCGAAEENGDAGKIDCDHCLCKACSRHQQCWKKVQDMVEALVRWRMEERRKARAEIREEFARLHPPLSQPRKENANVANSTKTDELSNIPSLPPSPQTQIASLQDVQLVLDHGDAPQQSSSNLLSIEPLPRFQFRDIVLATLTGMSSWPGMIIDPKNAGSIVLRTERLDSDDMFLVRFFPRGDYAWIPSQDIKHLTNDEIEAFLDEPYKKSEEILHAYTIALDPEDWEAVQVAKEQLAAEREEGDGNHPSHSKRRRGARRSSGEGNVNGKGVGNSASPVPRQHDLSLNEEAQKVREWRCKLQKCFLIPKNPPKEEDMPAMHDTFTTIENFPNMKPEYLQFSKLAKVMRHISSLGDGVLPRDGEFRFRSRAAMLAEKWHYPLPITSTAQAAQAGGVSTGS